MTKNIITVKMKDLYEEFIKNVYCYLIAKDISNCCNIIRKHTKKLDELGDLSFPLLMKNWLHIVDKKNEDTLAGDETIFNYNKKSEHSPNIIELQIEEFKKASLHWPLHIVDVQVKDNNVHLKIDRCSTFISSLNSVFVCKEMFGAISVSSNFFLLHYDEVIRAKSYNLLNLTEFRLLILENVTAKLLNFKTDTDVKDKKVCNLKWVIDVNKKNQPSTIWLHCGQISNQHNSKDNITTAEDILSKRTNDMCLIAQHKYGIRIKNEDSWKEYFEKLGKASVIIEMLQNKPHKSAKILINDLSNTVNKGPAFIFYNCARLEVLFRKFQEKVDNQVYPTLPTIEEIDFSLLVEPEEWELVYVYVVQFPSLIRSCIKDIKDGIINPHYLISFLSNLSSVFSVYYRRVRILIDPREHLFPLLHSRIYLLRSIQQIFHNILSLLDIAPIKEM